MVEGEPELTEATKQQLQEMKKQIFWLQDKLSKQIQGYSEQQLLSMARQKDLKDKI